MTADQVVDVLAVRDRLVAEPPVLMIGLVFGALVPGRAVGGVGRADCQCVALDAALAVVVQLTVVEVIGVIVVADRDVTATRR